MNLPKPTPSQGEVLVRLAAAGVNPIDWKIADGAFQAQMPYVFPLILGVDGAGVVEAVGPGVKRLSVNDTVFGQFFHPPAGIGTYAEYVVAPEAIGIAVCPPGMDVQQAAAVPTAGMTALQAIDQLGLAEGQSLLLFGAGGGVGSFAVQLASERGVTTLAVSRGANRGYLNKLGASRFYDSSTTSLLEEIRREHPAGVDALLDLAHRGPEFERNLTLVRRGGIVASTIGAAVDAVVKPRGFVGMNIGLRPSPELLDRLSEDFSSGMLRIPVEEKVPLEAAPEAIANSRQGKGRGKTVIRI
ncbi:MAG: NADP-dependent oxidoreductase [Thermoplasmata archaeon]